MRRDGDVRVRKHRIVGRTRFVVGRIEAEAAEMAGRQRIEYRRALDQVGSRRVHQDAARLHLRDAAAVEDVAGGCIAGQLHADEVALREHRFDRRVLGAIYRRLGGRHRRALPVQHAHAQRRSADRQLAADLAEADDAQGRLVQHADARDTRPVRVAGMAPVVHLRLVAGGLQLFHAEQPVRDVQLLRDVEHERDRVLGAGDVRAAALGGDRDAALAAGRRVDRARDQAVLLHQLEVLARGEFVGADGERLGDDRFGAGQLRTQVFLRLRRHHGGGIHRADLRTDVVAPGRKVGGMREEVDERVGALLRGGRVEHDLQDARERIVFDDDQRLAGIGHGVVQPFFGGRGSKSASSAVSTRVSML